MNARPNDLQEKAPLERGNSSAITAKHTAISAAKRDAGKCYSLRPPFTFQQAESALHQIPADIPRNEWAAIAAALRGEYGDVAFDIFDGWSAAGETYNRADVRDTWRSAGKRACSIGTLLFHAKKYGWTAPRRYPTTPSEQARIERETAEARRAREVRNLIAAQELAQSQACAARRAAEIWDSCVTESGSHAYLVRKHIGVCGTRRGLCEDAENAPLLVPLNDVDGTLHGLQEIYADGSKKFPYGTAKTGHFHAFGAPLDSTGWAFVGEGLATLGSFAAYSDYADAALIVAFDAGNVKPVAVALRAKYPYLQIIIAADWDTPAGGDGGAGYRFACAAAIEVDGEVIHPEPIQGRNKTDFNDWHVLQCERDERKAA